MNGARELSSPARRFAADEAVHPTLSGGWASSAWPLAPVGTEFPSGANPGHAFSRGEPVYDVTFENVQAGERTSHLFRLANLHRGLVI